MPHRAPLVPALIASACALSAAAHAQASVRASNPPAGFNDATDFPCIGRIDGPNGTGTGTVVGAAGMWVLTSRHNVCDDMGMPLPIANIRFKTGAQGTGHTVTMVVCNPDADIALFKLDDTLPAGYAISSAAIAAGTMFCTAGYGNTATGAGTPQGSWTDDTNDRRVYYNAVAGPTNALGYPASSYTYSCPGDMPAPVPGEGIGGPGDSGQPILTGGNTIRGVYYGNALQPDGTDQPTWGASGIFVNITPALETWINSTIPTPSALAPLALAALAMVPRRRPRTCHRTRH